MNETKQRPTMRGGAWLTIPALMAGCALGALAVWLTRSPRGDLGLRVPGADAVHSSGAAPAELEGTLTKGAGAPGDPAGTWPQFRGPDRDGISREKTTPARSWGSTGPKKLWSLDVGEGYAGAAVLAGRVYILDYDAARSSDVLRCLSLDDGKEIWSYAYPVKVKRNHGMSRTVPAVTEKYVVSLGPKCHVTCLDAAGGELRWAIDLVRDHGTAVPEWYAGQCPLIDGDKAILAPAGRELLMGVDCASGKIIWTTPNPRGWKMTHSSIMPAELAGRRMYVYCGSGGVIGVSARDGAVLWETEDWKIPIAAVPSPVALPDGRVLLSGGYDAGSKMIRVESAGGRFAVRDLFRLKAREFGAEQHTPIIHEGHIYGVRPPGQFVCLDLDGKQVWTSGSDIKIRLGPFLLADGVFYVLGDDGLLTLVEASPSGYKRLARARVLEGHECWAPMALANGRLIVRDLTQMACLDVR